MDPMAIARDVVRERFRDAVDAWLCGSAAANRLSPTSDVDVLVVQADGNAYRKSFAAHDVLVELFAHTEASLADWYEREAREYRCTLANMLATGTPLVLNARTERLQASARAWVDQGPPPRTSDEVDALRYHLSSALDDLVGCADPSDGLPYIAVDVVSLATELHLATCATWTGRGQWRHRWLASSSPELASQLGEGLLDVGRDRGELLRAAGDALSAAGGRLQEGYRLP